MKKFSLFGYGPAYALLGWILFSINDSLSKGVMTLENYASVGMVVQVSATLFLLFCLAYRGEIAYLWRCKLPLVIGYGVLMAICSVSFFYVLPRVPFAELFVFILMRPALGVVLSEILLKEKMTARQWKGFALAIVAVLITLQIWRFDLVHLFKYPPDVLLAIFLHVLTGAGNPLLVRRFGPHENPLVLAAYDTAFTALLLPFFFTVDLRALMPSGWSCATLAGFFSAAGTLFYLRGFQIGPANLASGAQYSQMVWTVVIGWLAFNEIPTPYAIAGAALVIFSGVLLFWPHRIEEERNYL